MKTILFTFIVVLFAAKSYGQDKIPVQTGDLKTGNQQISRRHSAGSTLWLLGNIGDSVNFFQLNYGYRLNQKVNLIVEAITWTYYEPLGTYMNSDELYPGRVSAYGLGLGYQRFLWKNLFTTFEPTFFVQQFYNSNDEKIQKGFQLYLQFILGYRVEIFKKRMFLEPAYALKYWPVNTNFPASFAAIESGKPKYKFEPSLNFGFRF